MDGQTVVRTTDSGEKWEREAVRELRFHNMY